MLNEIISAVLQVLVLILIPFIGYLIGNRKKMAEEILSKGKVIVKRPNREELLAIRSGKFEYKELIEIAEKASSNRIFI